MQQLHFNGLPSIPSIIKLEVYAVLAHSNVSLNAMRGHRFKGGGGHSASATAVSDSDIDREETEVTWGISDTPLWGPLLLQYLFVIH